VASEPGPVGVSEINRPVVARCPKLTALGSPAPPAGDRVGVAPSLTEF